MALSMLGHVSPGGGGKKLCIFEIRPESEFVVFRGSPAETPATTLKGTVVLMTQDSMQIKGGIRICFEGRRRLQHMIKADELRAGLHVGYINNKETFMHEEIRLLDPKGNPIRSLTAGNHAFPFEFNLPGDTAESVEGISTTHITYDLRAVCGRGVLTKDMVARKHVRIIRTLGPDAMENDVATSVSGVWPDKIKYCFEPASKNVIFGTSVATDIQLVPLLEKLGIEKIRFSITEVRRQRMEPGPQVSETGQSYGFWKSQEEVFSENMQLPTGCDEIDVDTQLPSFKFRATWNLPRSLATCRQSVDEGEYLRIEHFAHYDVQLRNPDGHLSELKAHHPLRLFISPHFAFDENNSVVTTPLSTPGEDPTSKVVPPAYGTHQFDMLVPLYDGIDPSGFFTPGPSSGAATPFNMHSRNASADNLSSFFDGSNQANPNVLSNRLRNLQMTSDSHSQRHHSSAHGFHPGSLPEDTLYIQRSNSSEGAEYISESTTPHHRGSGCAEDEEQGDYDLVALNRMPSYATAVRHAPHVAVTDVPPTYVTATSRPPSPHLQPPGRAHVHVRPGSSPRLDSR